MAKRKRSLYYDIRHQVIRQSPQEEKHRMVKISLLTGAARGVGLATSKKFSAQGCEILMLFRDEAELENEVKELAGASALCFDISSTEAATEIAASLTTSCSALAQW